MVKHLFKQLLLGILAGLAIGLGSFLFVLTKTFIKDELEELGNILAALVFSVGLFLVCTFSLSLFTGKIGLVFEKKQDLPFYLSLPVMIIGNAIGAIGLGYICYAIFKDTSLYQVVEAATKARTDVYNPVTAFLPFLRTLIKGVACGLCVYFAVKSFSFNRLRPVGILLLIFFVFIFVYFGFEHCIANMFYFSMANKWDGGAFIDLFLVIFANSIGTIPGVFLLKLTKKS